jgi:rubrerythrin
MHQELSSHDAINFVIETQKSLAGFYQAAAGRVANESGQRVFARLADETRSRLAHNYQLHYGSGHCAFDSFMASPMLGDSAMLHELQQQLTADLNDHQAREIAIREELDIEQRLHLYARNILNPIARDILLQAAAETGRHAQIIESEYAHTMRMVHETDIDTYVRE